MEDVLEGIVVPHWNFGSIVLVVMLLAALVTLALAAIEAFRWIEAKRKKGFTRGDWWIVILFVLFIIASALLFPLQPTGTASSLLLCLPWLFLHAKFFFYPLPFCPVLLNQGVD